MNRITAVLKNLLGLSEKDLKEDLFDRSAYYLTLALAFAIVCLSVVILVYLFRGRL